MLLKKVVLSSTVALSTLIAMPALANNTMLKYFNNPTSAPKVAECKGNQNCNAFVALAKQWQSIPNNYRYHSFNIKKEASIGNGYGLYKGYSVSSERGMALQDAGYNVFYDGGSKGKAKERIFAQGTAVLLYIEDVYGLSD